MLLQVAKNDEVLIAISNQNYARPGGMLDSWMRTAESVGLKNAMVVALDEATKAHAESQGMMSIIMDATVSTEPCPQALDPCSLYHYTLLYFCDSSHSD